MWIDSYDWSHCIFDYDTINLLSYRPPSVTGIEFVNIFDALGMKAVKILIHRSIEVSIKKLDMDLDVKKWDPEGVRS